MRFSPIVIVRCTMDCLSGRWFAALPGSGAEEVGLSFDEEDVSNPAVNDEHAVAKLLFCAIEPIVFCLVAAFDFLREARFDARGAIGILAVSGAGMEVWKQRA